MLQGLASVKLILEGLRTTLYLPICYWDARGWKRRDRQSHTEQKQHPFTCKEVIGNPHAQDHGNLLDAPSYTVELESSSREAGAHNCISSEVVVTLTVTEQLEGLFSLQEMEKRVSMPLFPEPNPKFATSTPLKPCQRFGKSGCKSLIIALKGFSEISNWNLLLYRGENPG